MKKISIVVLFLLSLSMAQQAYSARGFGACPTGVQIYVNTGDLQHVALVESTAVLVINNDSCIISELTDRELIIFSAAISEVTHANSPFILYVAEAGLSFQFVLSGFSS